MSAAVGVDVVPEALLVPPGVPVRSGRVHVGRLRGRLPASGRVRVLAGFRAACWLGGPDDTAPGLGELVFRGETALDRRGRAVLCRQARAWLAVADPAVFDAVAMAAPEGGVLVVPVEGFAGRVGSVSL